jgi:hypothetical protein
VIHFGKGGRGGLETEGEESSIGEYPLAISSQQDLRGEIDEGWGEERGREDR